MLERALEGGFNFLDAMITPDGCSMLNRCVEQQFMKASHATLWSVAGTAREAVDIIASQLENGVPRADSKL